ncbi:esterase [Rhodocytophaga rosea]|uniref:Esterase n=1 Tax=Rhodocytophaga rosea TaxID=2704465 RepID=A0A6C0GRE2_9BACT|nr:esterase [Rhodocytophaga rosea]QHT70665.1 esterase [Rhodocytophaga rosea]
MFKLFFTCCLLILSLCLQAQNNAPRIISPDIQPDNSVIFRIKAPGASSVKVIGTWAADFKPVPMVKKDSSIYEVKIGPLASDMYEYRFILDSTMMLDPNNNAVTRDGSIVENRLLIPGKLGDLFAAQNVPHGNVTAVWYNSPTLGTQRRMHIYTPPGYEQGKDKYPVVYLLHGGGGDEEGWINRGRANYIFDNLIASKQAVPMIVVITNGNPDAVAAPLDRPLNMPVKDATGIGGMASLKFEESLVKDVVPYIEKNYRVIADADHRALTGFSMGGYQTQNITNANPGMFKYIGVMSMGLFSSFRNNSANYNKEKHIAQLKALMAAKPKYYWIGIGKDDFLFETVTKLRSLYDELGFKYTYRESEGSHTWKEWRLYLTELAPKFFK